MHPSLLLEMSIHGGDITPVAVHRPALRGHRPRPGLRLECRLRQLDLTDVRVVQRCHRPSRLREGGYQVNASANPST